MDLVQEGPEHLHADPRRGLAEDRGDGEASPEGARRAVRLALHVRNLTYDICIPKSVEEQIQLWRARSRLYRSRLLKVNALTKYWQHFLDHLQDL